MHGLRCRLKTILEGQKYDKITKCLGRLDGCEIGGPSEIFYKIYRKVNSCDGVNYSSNTVWTGELSEDYLFRRKKLGKQLVMDATELVDIQDERYDFVLSSNNLEHIANPMKAVREWVRILKNEGFLVIVVPNKEFTFDHKRNVTTFEHLFSDFKNNITEDDLTHLDEILELHDLSLDKAAGAFDEFKKRSLDNFNNRCLHQHVFDLNLLEMITLYFNLETIWKGKIYGNWVILTKKILNEKNGQRFPKESGFFHEKN